MAQEVGSGSSNLNFVSIDREMGMVENLLCAVQKERITSDSNRVAWIGAASDKFSVREAYKVLKPRSPSPFPTKGVWISSVPTRSTFLCLGRSCA